MKIAVRAVVICTALVAAACGFDTLTSHIYRGAAPEHFAYAAGGRDFATVIIGNPFAEPKDAVDVVVTSAMQGKHPGPRTHFTTRPDGTAAPGYRITIMFNPAMTVQASDLCGDVSDLRPQKAAADLRLLAAFCSHGNPISHVYAVTAAVNSVENPKLRKTIANVMFELIPAVDPFIGDDTRTSQNRRNPRGPVIGGGPTPGRASALETAAERHRHGA